MTRIEPIDLNQFEFDHDLTMMIFFLDAEGRLYSRYGGRDAESPDSRQSLAGLHYTMESVLRMHEARDKAYAPRPRQESSYVRDLSGVRRGGKCLHCHQVKEVANAQLLRSGRWNNDLAWRFPLPENVGLLLEVDRGNVVKKVLEKSPAATAGLKPGDVVRLLNGVPIHSFGDVQFALDIAPKVGDIGITWVRGDQTHSAKLALKEGWRKTDLTWRPSMQRLIPSPRLYGDDLSDAEKQKLGLPVKQLAFRQKKEVPAQARAAGIQGGDIIVGVDGQALEMNVDQFVRYMQRTYLVGDRVTVNVLRDGKKLELRMTLQR